MNCVGVHVLTLQPSSYLLHNDVLQYISITFELSILLSPQNLQLYLFFILCNTIKCVCIFSSGLDNFEL